MTFQSPGGIGWQGNSSQATSPELATPDILTQMSARLSPAEERQFRIWCGAKLVQITELEVRFHENSFVWNVFAWLQHCDEWLWVFLWQPARVILLKIVTTDCIFWGDISISVIMLPRPIRNMYYSTTRMALIRKVDCLVEDPLPHPDFKSIHYKSKVSCCVIVSFVVNIL
jgi:hypothetical protein